MDSFVYHTLFSTLSYFRWSQKKEGNFRSKCISVLLILPESLLHLMFLVNILNTNLFRTWSQLSDLNINFSLSSCILYVFHCLCNSHNAITNSFYLNLPPISVTVWNQCDRFKVSRWLPFLLSLFSCDHIWFLVYSDHSDQKSDHSGF